MLRHRWPRAGIWGQRSFLTELLEDRTAPATITVDSFLDNTTDDGQITLREAIIAANTDSVADPTEGVQTGSGDDTIALPAGTYALSIAGNNEDVAATGDLDITGTAGSLTIVGAGAAQTIIDANNIDRVFEVLSATFNLTGVTVTGGGNTGTLGGGGLRSGYSTVSIIESTITANTSDQGGGILDEHGVLTLTDSVVSNNVASLQDGRGGGIYFNKSTATLTRSTIADNTNSNGYGGGICSYGDTNSNLTIIDSTISGNSAAGSGAGIRNNATPLTIIDSTITDNHSTAAGHSGGGLYNSGAYTPFTYITKIVGSTFSGNSATDKAGGIMNRADGVMHISNSTISGNTAGDAGGIWNYDSSVLTIINSTITANSSTSTGGILNDGNPISIRNTIVAGNIGASISPDVSGSFATRGNNLIGDVGTATGFTDGVNGDQVGTTGSPIDPLLGPLQDNGGPTFTHALLAGSPAIDAGGVVGVLTTDQRGAPRLVDGDGDGTSTADIGAYEYIDGFLVDSSADTVDANPGDGVATDVSGNTSLRAAVMEANALGGDQTIALPAGTYTLSIAGTSEDGAATGDLDITDASGTLSIVGVGAEETIIAADGIDRAFQVLPNVAAAFERVTITGGNAASESGGGVSNAGDLEITNCVVSANSADSAGGIWNALTGSLTLTDTTLAGNTATSGTGGGIDNDGIVTATNSTLSGNTASTLGGGIANSASATVTLNNSTVSGNEADDGGGVHNSGTLTINHSTFSANTADFNGGGVFNAATGTFNFGSTILAGNTSNANSGIDGYNEAGGTINSQGFNLVGNDIDFAFTPALAI